jgi:hypothetical protein
MRLGEEFTADTVPTEILPTGMRLGNEFTADKLAKAMPRHSVPTERGILPTGMRLGKEFTDCLGEDYDFVPQESEWCSPSLCNDLNEHEFEPHELPDELEPKEREHKDYVAEHAKYLSNYCSLPSGKLSALIAKHIPKAQFAVVGDGPAGLGLRRGGSAPPPTACNGGTRLSNGAFSFFPKFGVRSSSIPLSKSVVEPGGARARAKVEPGGARASLGVGPGGDRSKASSQFLRLKQAWEQRSSGKSSGSGSSGSSKPKGPGLLQFEAIEAPPKVVSVKKAPIRTDKAETFKGLLAGSEVAKRLHITPEAINQAIEKKFDCPSGVVRVSGSSHLFAQQKDKSDGLGEQEIRTDEF